MKHLGFAILPLALILSGLASPVAAAQGPPPGRGPDDRQIGQEMRRNLANRLRADLSLTDRQAEAVLPKVEAIEDERIAERRERREAARDLHRGLRTGATDADLEKGLARLEEIQDTHRAKVRALLSDIDRSLTARQRVELRFFVVKYRRDMVRRIREFRGGRADRPAGPGDAGPEALADDWP